MVFYVVINDTGENFISGDEEALISKFPRQTVYRCELPAGSVCKYTRLIGLYK